MCLNLGSSNDRSVVHRNLGISNNNTEEKRNSFFRALNILYSSILYI
jgi:hypothetical protein